MSLIKFRLPIAEQNLLGAKVDKNKIICYIRTINRSLVEIAHSQGGGNMNQESDKAELDSDRIKNLISIVRFRRVSKWKLVAHLPHYVHCGRPMYLISFCYIENGIEYNEYERQMVCSNPDCPENFTEFYWVSNQYKTRPHIGYRSSLNIFQWFHGTIIEIFDLGGD